MGDSGEVGERMVACGGVQDETSSFLGEVGRDTGGVGGMSPVISDRVWTASINILTAARPETEKRSQFSLVRVGTSSVCDAAVWTSSGLTFLSAPGSGALGGDPRLDVFPLFWPLLSSFMIATELYDGTPVRARRLVQE